MISLTVFSLGAANKSAIGFTHPVKVPMPTPYPPPSRLSGRYTIERERGRGGMATVYLVQDREEWHC